ncbi:MAG: hypothetical protein HRT80_00825 [Henriciella sp.]|nr:hypothetical protein [Henriciella sp.]
MRDLREDLDPVWRSAMRLAGVADGARIMMFTSAVGGEGVSSMAASFACLAARRSEQPVWLVDLDFRRNPQFNAFKKGFARDVGKPGRAFDASLKQAPIFDINPKSADSRFDKLLTVNEIERLSLLVSRFRGERLSSGQTVSLQNSPDWWKALRQIAGWVIVDAPSLSQSSAALTMASMADGIALVVAADHTTPSEVEDARHQLEARQGRVLGAVLNRVKADARFADRFSA